MAEAVKDFYDRLAGNYHLIFEDWDASLQRQGAALAAILERECGAASTLRILDCACGIGTQSLGLASLGFTVTACDLSPASVERARVEAAKRRMKDSDIDSQRVLRDLDAAGKIDVAQTPTFIVFATNLPPQVLLGHALLSKLEEPEYQALLKGNGS